MTSRAPFRDGSEDKAPARTAAPSSPRPLPLTSRYSTGVLDDCSAVCRLRRPAASTFLVAKQPTQGTSSGASQLHVICTCPTRRCTTPAHLRDRSTVEQPFSVSCFAKPAREASVRGPFILQNCGGWSQTRHPTCYARQASLDCTSPDASDNGSPFITPNRTLVILHNVRHRYQGRRSQGRRRAGTTGSDAPCVEVCTAQEVGNSI